MYIICLCVGLFAISSAYGKYNMWIHISCKTKCLKKCVRDYLQLLFSLSQYIGARVFIIVKILLKVWSIIISKEDPNFGEFTSEKN